MKKNKLVTYNMFYSLLSRVIIFTLGLLLPRIMLINFGTEVNGLINSINQFITCLSLFEAGLQTVALKALYHPVSVQNRDEINGIVSAVSISYRRIGIMYLSVLTIFAIAYSALVKVEGLTTLDVFAVFLFSGLTNVVVFFFLAKYQVLLLAEGRSYLFANLQSIIFVINSLLKILLILLNCSIVAVVVSAFLVSLIQIFYITWYIKRHYSWLNTKATPKIDSLQQKSHALVHQISTLIFNNMDVVLLTVFGDLKIVSVYSMYKLVVSQISSLLTLLSGSCSFAMGQLFYTDQKKYTAAVDALETYFGAIVFAIYTVVLQLLYPFMKLYTNGAEGISYLDMNLVYLFVSIELLTLMRTMCNNTIHYAGHFKETVFRSLLETAINVIVSIVGINFLGIYGVLLGTVCALLYRTVDIIIYANKRILQQSPFKTFCIYFINIIILLALNVLFPLFGLSINSYGEFIVAGIVYTGVSLVAFLTVQSICHPTYFKEVLRFLKTKFRKEN